MKKIETLTKEQEALIQIVRDEWLSYFYNFRDIDKELAQKSIQALYQLCGYDAPRVWWCDSPMQAQIVANILCDLDGEALDGIETKIERNVGRNIGQNIWQNVEQNIRQNVEQNIWQNIWQNVEQNIWQNVGQNIWQNIWQNVEQNIRQNVGQKVWQNIGRDVEQDIGRDIWQFVRENIEEKIEQVSANAPQESLKLSHIPFGYYMHTFMAGWCGYVDYFLRQKIIPEVPGFDHLCNVVKAGVYDTIQFKNLCIAIRLPSFAHQDESNRLHSLSGPAIGWPDGYECYYVHGVSFDRELYTKVISGSMGFVEIMGLENIEQRMIALKLMGAEKLLTDAKAQQIGTTSERGNALYLVKGIFSDPAYFLKYSCPSTGRVYVSGIDPQVGIDGDPDACMAWKFSLTKDEYLSIREES